MGTTKNPPKTLTRKTSAPIGQSIFESILSEKNPPDKQELSSSEFIEPATDGYRYLPVPSNALKSIACPSRKPRPSQMPVPGEETTERKRLGTKVVL
jgi:hypothetical protein